MPGRADPNLNVTPDLSVFMGVGSAQQVGGARDRATRGLNLTDAAGGGRPPLVSVIGAPQCPPSPRGFPVRPAQSRPRLINAARIATFQAQSAELISPSHARPSRARRKPHCRRIGRLLSGLIGLARGRPKPGRHPHRPDAAVRARPAFGRTPAPAQSGARAGSIRGARRLGQGRAPFSTATMSAWRRFLSILPTGVVGSSPIHSRRSGHLNFATPRPSRWRRISLSSSGSPVATR